MVRSSCGRFSCIRFIKSRNLVSVRAVVAICWRKLAMYDYTREGRSRGQRVQRDAPSIIPREPYLLCNQDRCREAARAIMRALMPLTPGTKLGPYEIESPLGPAGMG